MISIYPGTFDPITFGHLDIIKRSLIFFNKLIIAVGINPGKNPLFSYEERAKLIVDTLIKYLNHDDFINKIKVCHFSGLLGDFAKEEKANLLVRGIRNVSDFEYEINLANINKVICPNVETVFLPTSPHLTTISSSMVKEIAKFGGMVDPFVSSNVATAIYDKFRKSP